MNRTDKQREAWALQVVQQSGVDGISDVDFCMAGDYCDEPCSVHSPADKAKEAGVDAELAAEVQGCNLPGLVKNKGGAK